MKNLKTIALVLFSVALITACKKKEDKAAEPTPVTPAPPAHVNKFTAKIDGNDWSMATNAYSISKSGTFYNFSGYTSFSNPKSTIYLSATSCPTPGTYTLGSSFSGLSMSYTDVNNTTFTSQTGTINITTFDTLAPNAGIINKFKATFSFNTGTISSVNHTVTNGEIDYEKQ